MACENVVPKARRKELLRELEVELATGRQKVVKIGGRVGLSNWTGTAAAKAGLCDGCVMAELGRVGNWVTQQKLRAAGVVPGKTFASMGHAGHPHKG